MKIQHNDTIRFSAEVGLGDRGEILIGYDNRGEPYREGISIHLETGTRTASAFLDKAEALAVRDLIDRLFPRGSW